VRVVSLLQSHEKKHKPVFHGGRRNVHAQRSGMFSPVKTGKGMPEMAGRFFCGRAKPNKKGRDLFGKKNE
jgi:hypothetical protein